MDSLYAKNKLWLKKRPVLSGLRFYIYLVISAKPLLTPASDALYLQMISPDELFFILYGRVFIK